MHRAASSPDPGRGPARETRCAPRSTRTSSGVATTRPSIPAAGSASTRTLDPPTVVSGVTMRLTTAPSIHRASPGTAPGNAGGGGENVAPHPTVARLRQRREPGEANPEPRG